MIFELLQRWVLRIGGLALAFNGGVWLWESGLGPALSLATGLVVALAVVAAHCYWPVVLLCSGRYFTERL